MRNHERTFLALFDGFKKVVDAVVSKNGTFSFEWPSDNRYWTRDDVRVFLSQHNTDSFRVYGCAFGLKLATGPEAGKYHVV